MCVALEEDSFLGFSVQALCLAQILCGTAYYACIKVASENKQQKKGRKCDFPAILLHTATTMEIQYKCVVFIPDHIGL